MFGPTKEEIDELRNKGFSMQTSKRFITIQKMKDANRSSNEPFIQQMIIAEILELL